MALTRVVKSSDSTITGRESTERWFTSSSEGVGQPCPVVLSGGPDTLVSIRMRASSATLLLSVCAASLAIPARLASQQPSACRRPSPYNDLRARFERFISSDDSVSVDFRREFQLPHLPPDSVLTVTDERICERAARAYFQDHLGPRPLDGVEVLRVGDMYIVYGSKWAGEWVALEFYTRDFVYVGGMLS